jgi:class 3 adenylate cyclase/tetratricopeptide (TPR) repeat protein
MTETRKTVTVVFADVTGSTSLGERLDPEATRHIMERYFVEARTALEIHGGTVEKFIGDAVCAVFGIPAVHEDDPLRAVRAATEMRDRLGVLNEELEREHGVTIAVRTGVNTGEVVAGDAALGQSFATGDAVNVAARLEQAAAPGEILLGPLAYRLVREAVRVEELEPLVLKGKSTAVSAWRLVEVLPDAPAYTRRITTPFIGRSEELAALAGALAEARQTGAARLVTVMGTAGVGKSRLVREFLASPDVPRSLVGRCLPYGEGITYWPLNEIVRQVAGSDYRAGLEELLRDHGDANLVADLVASAVGASEGRRRNEEIAWAVRRLLEALAADRALVVVFDDVHWAEPTLLDLVEYLESLAAAPILLVCVARPELLEARPSWATPHPTAALLMLDPLSGEETTELVEALGAEAGEAEVDVERIVRAADGNPLFAEQLLAFETEGGSRAALEIAPTIQGLLAARIDALEPPERAVIERGAVEGRLFHRGAVSALLPDEERTAVVTHLMTLVRKQLIRPDRSEFEGDDGFRFSHVLVREAAYAAVSKESRAELHASYAHWLEAKARDRLPELEEILGFHLEQSFLLRRELRPLDDDAVRLGDTAAERLASAGRRAFERGDLSAASNLLGRAFDLLEGREESARDDFADLLESLLKLGDYTSAVRFLERVEGTDDLSLAAYAGVYRGTLLIQTAPEGASEQAMRIADEAIEQFEATGDDLGLARAWMLVNAVHWQQGHLTAAMEASERARSHAARAGDQLGAIDAQLSTLALMHFDATPFGQVVGIFDEFAAEARGRGDRLVEGETLAGLAVVLASLKRMDEARELGARSAALLADVGAKIHLAAFNARAQIAELAEDWLAAERGWRESVEMLERMGDRGFLSTAASSLARALVEQGLLDEAESAAELSRSAGASDDVVTQCGWRGVQARILAARGELPEAEALAREAHALADPSEYESEKGEVALDLAEVLAASGRIREAADALEEALALFEGKENLVMADRARARLAQLGTA